MALSNMGFIDSHGLFVSTSTGDILFPSEFKEFEPFQVANLKIPVKPGGIAFIGIDKRSNSHMHTLGPHDCLQSETRCLPR
jgi:hypothetical protein